MLVDVIALPPGRPACQFPTCFAGLDDAAAVRARYAVGSIEFVGPPAKAAEVEPAGIVVGQTVVIRDLESQETERWQIVSPGAERRDGCITSGSPLGRELLGRGVGDVISVELPRRSGRFEVLEVIPVKSREVV